ncbi:TPA: hypothetical protein ACF3XQ_004051 [Vibrio parahaemolyticus]
MRISLLLLPIALFFSSLSHANPLLVPHQVVHSAVNSCVKVGDIATIQSVLDCVPGKTTTNGRNIWGECTSSDPTATYVEIRCSLATTQGSGYPVRLKKSSNLCEVKQGKQFDYIWNMLTSGWDIIASEEGCLAKSVKTNYCTQVDGQCGGLLMYTGDIGTLAFPLNAVNPYPKICKKDPAKSGFKCPIDANKNGLPDDTDQEFDPDAVCGYDAVNKFACSGGTFEHEPTEPDPDVDPDEPETEPPLDRRALIDYLISFSEYLGYVGTKPATEDLLSQLSRIKESLQTFKSTTLPQVRANGNQILHGASALVQFIEVTKTNLEMKLGTSKTSDELATVNSHLDALNSSLNTYKDIFGDDADLLHSQLIESKNKIEYVHEQAESLSQQVDVIDKASEQVSELPSIILKLERSQSLLEKQLSNLSKKFKSAESDLSLFKDNTNLASSYTAEIKELVDECKRSRNVVVAEGLAAGFEKKAQELQTTILWWIAGLVCALIMGMVFGYFRAEQLNSVLQQQLSIGQSMLHFLITVFSVGGPFWLAWLSTRQINKCFTLAEDYAYKATVTRAYTGFQDEAKKFADDTAQQIFKSAISRLDEMPLRLIADKDYNSPWQDLLNSEVIKKAGPEVMLEITKALTNSKARFNVKKPFSTGGVPQNVEPSSHVNGSANH